MYLCTLVHKFMCAMSASASISAPLPPAIGMTTEDLIQSAADLLIEGRVEDAITALKRASGVRSFEREGETGTKRYLRWFRAISCCDWAYQQKHRRTFVVWVNDAGREEQVELLRHAYRIARTWIDNTSPRACGLMRGRISYEEAEGAREEWG